MWLPDTNFWIDILKRPTSPAAERFRLCQTTDLAASVVVWAELLHGARKYGLPEQRRQTIHRLLQPFRCLDVTLEVADLYGEVRHGLESQGKLSARSTC